MKSFQLVWYWLSWQSDRSLCFVKMEEAICRSVGCCTETWRLSTSSTVVGCVHCMYVVVSSLQLLVLFAGGVELCSEEMTDNQGEL